MSDWIYWSLLVYVLCFRSGSQPAGPQLSDCLGSLCEWRPGSTLWRLWQEPCRRLLEEDPRERQLVNWWDWVYTGEARVGFFLGRRVSGVSRVSVSSVTPEDELWAVTLIGGLSRRLTRLLPQTPTRPAPSGPTLSGDDVDDEWELIWALWNNVTSVRSLPATVKFRMVLKQDGRQTESPSGCWEMTWTFLFCFFYRRHFNLWSANIYYTVYILVLLLKLILTGSKWL